jgi:hypothetical protein
VKGGGAAQIASYRKDETLSLNSFRKCDVDHKIFTGVTFSYAKMKKTSSTEALEVCRPHPADTGQGAG